MSFTRNKKYLRLTLFLAAFCLTVLAGRWAMGLLLTSEYVHFSANFPVHEGAEVMGRDGVGGPWTMLPGDEWKGYPKGGMMVWGREGEVRFDVGGQSFLKRLFQPWDLTIATYWIRNVGPTPRRIKLDLDMCGMPVEWVTFEREWDNKTKTTLREIMPGKTFAMDWHIQVPPERQGRKVICSGGLKIMDAETGEILTSLPIEIVDSREKK